MEEDKPKAVRHTRSRVKKTNGAGADITLGSKEILTWTCRKCLKTRPIKDYYKATDSWDSSGYMSICRFCLEDAYERYYITEKTLDKAILKLCREVNVKFDSTALEATRKNIETSESKGKVLNSIFGIYRRNLVNAGFGGFTSESDLTYQGAYDFIPNDSLNNKDISVEDREYLEESWGKGLDIEDYNFLEERYAKWTRTTEVDNYGVEILLRELCHKENEIRKARVQGNSVDGLVKALQEIMKNSALTPALQNAASNARSFDAYGVWLKDIETLSPAEWWEDQTKYKDIDGISEDISDIKRSIKSYITGSREYSSVEIEEIEGLTDDLESDGE